MLLMTLTKTEGNVDIERKKQAMGISQNDSIEDESKSKTEANHAQVDGDGVVGIKTASSY